MSDRRLILREAGLSAVINGVLSLVFFLLVFGLARPVPLASLAADGLPQTFMVTLMGCLVPGLIVGHRLGRARRPIVLRAVAFALAAVAVLGGLGWWIFHARAGSAPVLSVLALKILYGAVLGAIVTALAVRLVLQGGHDR